MKKVRILALDGGGIRGIVPATIMQYVESELQRKTKDKNAKIADYFDLIAGTSTGGILSCIYLAPDTNNKPRFTATEALEFYSKEGGRIFTASKVPAWKRIWGLSNATGFSAKNIEGLFKEKFVDLKMSELLKPCLITTYNMATRSSFFFTSNEDPTKREFFVRDVTRSTSAAPTYFAPAKVKNIAPDPVKDKDPVAMVNIDGGVFANNPSMCAYAEARNTDFTKRGRDFNEPKASEMLILSIGTGGGNFKLPEIKKSHKWGVLSWAKSIPEIMMDGSVDTVAFQMNEIFGTLKEENRKCYLRIDVPQDARNYAPDMSDASPENLVKLKKAGEETLKHGISKGLDDFIDMLIDEPTA
jgi:patatin-like phospholipase/acyl hydrolase